MKTNLVKFISLFLGLMCVLSLMAGCSGSNSDEEGGNVFTSEVSIEEGKISCVPVKAYYGDGSNDKDTGTATPEGSLIVNVGIANGLKYPKSIRALTLSLSDENNEAIVEETTFDLATPQTINPGEATEVQCIFYSETVFKEIALDTIKSTATVYYVGSVVKGDEPKETKDTVTASIVQAGYVSCENYELTGKIKIKNNKDHMVTPQEIRFWVKTQDGKKIHSTELLIANDVALKAGETITLPFTITASDAPDNIEKIADFEYVVADYDIKIKE